MSESPTATGLKEADKAVAAADAAVIFAMRQQVKFCITLAIVSIVFALSMVSIVAIHAWQDSQVYTEIQYEAVGSMGNSNAVNTGEGTIQSASTITNNQ